MQCSHHGSWSFPWPNIYIYIKILICIWYFYSHIVFRLYLWYSYFIPIYKIDPYKEAETDLGPGTRLFLETLETWIWRSFTFGAGSDSEPFISIDCLGVSNVDLSIPGKISMWGFPIYGVHIPNSWMVYFMEHSNLIAGWLPGLVITNSLRTGKSPCYFHG